MNPGRPARRDRQGRLRLAAAIRRRRCWRCSTRHRTTRFGTTTSSWNSTCPTCCSSRPRTCVDNDPGRAARPDGDGVHRRLHRATRRRRSPVDSPCYPNVRWSVQWTSTSGGDSLNAQRSKRSLRTTPAKRVCDGSNGCWTRRCARWPLRDRSTIGRRDRPVTIGVDDLRRLLGRARFPRGGGRPHRSPAGVATGLAVTGMPVATCCSSRRCRCPSKGDERRWWSADAQAHRANSAT
jgi:hypothetical protein